MKKVVVKLNPQDKVVSEIKEALKKNKGYCPCALEKNDNTLCMCKEFKTRVKELKKAKEGTAELCHCGLYMAYVSSEEL